MATDALRKTKFLIILSLILVQGSLLSWGSSAAPPKYNLPKVTVSKALTKYTIEKNDWTTVKIVITGDTREQTQPFPTAVVLAIDYSASMANDNAYKDAGTAAKKAVDRLTPGLDKLGIITIRSTADWAVPLTPLTTTNKVSIKQKIDTLSPSGSTNLQQAFVKANNALAADASNNKVVILMSDGYPTPNFPVQQNYLFTNRYVPAASGIKYFTIGFGENPNEPLLKSLADATGGTYQKAATKTALVPTFKKAVDDGRYFLTVRQVVIEEAVSKKLKIRPGSLTWSSAPPSNDPVAFDNAMQKIKQTFHQTNSLKVPTINQLPGNSNFTLTFDVTVETCGEQDTKYNVNDPFPTSKVTFISGGQKNIETVPQQQLEVQACDVHLEKEFDPKTHTVTLTVRNDYPRPITKVLILEVTSSYFIPEKPTSPPHDLLDQMHHQVRWGDMATNKIQLAPDEVRKFSFQLGLAAAAKGKSGPLDIDHERASVDYTVDLRYFKVDVNEPGFNDFEKDLQTLTVSKATSQWLTNWFANKPDPYKKGTKLGMQYNVPEGTQFMVVLHVPGTPQPEFGWILPGGPRLLKIKKSLKQISVYVPTLRYKAFPQKQTPPDYPP